MCTVISPARQPMSSSVSAASRPPEGAPGAAWFPRQREEPLVDERALGPAVQPPGGPGDHGAQEFDAAPPPAFA
jgi:hypothetical protein